MGIGLPRVILIETDLSYYVDTMLKGIFSRRLLNGGTPQSLEISLRQYLILFLTCRITLKENE